MEDDRMTFKEQLKKIKDNWLIAVIIIVLFLFISGGGNMMMSGLTSQIGYRGIASYDGYYDYGVAESSVAKGGMYYPTSGGDFAPEVEDRLIVKTASMTTEVERGEFKEAETKLHSIIKSSDSYLLSENVNKYGTERREYYSGYYTIKVEVEKYDSVVTQLRDLGEIQSFTQNQQDITGRYTDVQVELEAEKERLKRYQSMYDEATEVSDKIELSDRIFNQERTIKYMEEALDSMDKRVAYSTVYLTMNEEQSEYADIIFVKISELIRSFVGSLNGLISLIVVIIPWAIAVWLITWVVKLIKRKKK